MVDWTDIIISVCSLIITGILIPVLKELYTKIKTEIELKLDKEDQELIKNLAEVLVRWAKQVLKSNTGEEKKSQVMSKLVAWLNKIGIEVDEEYLDCVVEAIYEQVKKEPVSSEESTADAVEAVETLLLEVVNTSKKASPTTSRKTTTSTAKKKSTTTSKKESE